MGERISLSEVQLRWSAVIVNLLKTDIVNPFLSSVPSEMGCLDL